jgi:hypothetical protein
MCRIITCPNIKVVYLCISNDSNKNSVQFSEKLQSGCPCNGEALRFMWCVSIFNSFNDIVSNCGYIKSNYWKVTNDELERIWKDVE